MTTSQEIHEAAIRDLRAHNICRGCLADIAHDGNGWRHTQEARTPRQRACQAARPDWVASAGNARVGYPWDGGVIERIEYGPAGEGMRAQISGADGKRWIRLHS
jgi:hypothetical protein